MTNDNSSIEKNSEGWHIFSAGNAPALLGWGTQDQAKRAAELCHADRVLAGYHDEVLTRPATQAEVEEYDLEPTIAEPLDILRARRHTNDPQLECHWPDVRLISDWIRDLERWAELDD